MSGNSGSRRRGARQAELTEAGDDEPSVVNPRLRPFKTFLDAILDHRRVRRRCAIAIRPEPELTIKPLTPSRIDDFAHVLKSSGSGSSCWDIFPRLTGVEQRAEGLDGAGAKRRAKLTSLAKRRHAPGLLAYRGREAVGWISIGPRSAYHRTANSKATPAVDEVPVWAIPCITVRTEHRAEGIATALIRAAVAFATERGAPAIEAYPRADGKRVHDEWAFYGTEALFKKAGFKRVRGVLPMPKGWTPRVTMRSR